MRWRKGVLAGAMLALLSLLASTAANAQKHGGTLRIFHRDSPANMSIHEEGTISVVAPMMPIFNNLVLFNQHEKQNRLDDIVPILPIAGAGARTARIRRSNCTRASIGTTARRLPPPTSSAWDLLQGRTKEKLRLNAREAM